jgi:hypothetical protein
VPDIKFKGRVNPADGVTAYEYCNKVYLKLTPPVPLSVCCILIKMGLNLAVFLVSRPRGKRKGINLQHARGDWKPFAEKYLAQYLLMTVQFGFPVASNKQSQEKIKCPNI